MTTKTYNPNKGRIVRGGQGGFLNPPDHPDHAVHVETELRRHRENRATMSLTYAANDDALDDYARNAAQGRLDKWDAEKHPLTHPDVKDWIAQVLGYFRGCYKGFPVRSDSPWNADNLIIDQERDPVEHADTHAGVHFIRGFYPDFEPSVEHFIGAYWGTKPEGKE